MAAAMPNAINFITTFKDIEIDHLDLIEEELRFRQLVSLGFLLYGNNRVNAQYMLQKLVVMCNAPEKRSNDMLSTYARNNPDWRTCIVEALSIIRAKRVLCHLGFDWEQLRVHYLPHVPELSLHINPVLKALYMMCDRLTCAKAQELIRAMKEQTKLNDETLLFNDASLLEMYLLDWLSNRFIEVADHDIRKDHLEKLLISLKLANFKIEKAMIETTIKCQNKAQQVEKLEMPIKAQMHDDTAKQAEQKREQVQPLSGSRISEKAAAGASKVTLVPSIAAALENRYQLRKRSAGIILIINQQQFYRETDAELQHLLPKHELLPRTGTDLDRDYLQRVFSSYGYAPLVLNNLTHLEMQHHIRQSTMRSFQYDSLIVCILSHGAEGVIYGCNSIPVGIDAIEQIIAAPTLQNKPKLLILQACQRDKEPRPQQNCKANNTPDRFADILKAMSTVPGFVSLRHKKEGTWFIQALCQKIDELGEHLKMQDIMTRVIDAVRSKRGLNDEIMVPIYTSSMTKDFHLSERNAQNPLN